MDKKNKNIKRPLDVNSEAEFTSIISVPCVDTEAPNTRLSAPAVKVELYPSIWITLSVMSLVGIVAVVLHFKMNNVSDEVEMLVLESEESGLEAEKDPSPEEDAEAINNEFSNDIELIAKHCSSLATLKNSFAIFEHGTCVLLIEPINDREVSARSTLKILANANMEFEVRTLDNNNYQIVFNKYLSCWIFADHLAKNKDSLMIDKRLDRNKRDSPKIRSLTDMEIRVGKLARLCLIKDSKKLIIEKIVKVPTISKKIIPTSK